MTWGTEHSYPRAILHIDGDSFFASCEVAKNPALRGKPVVTGKERGIVSAATYEAKAFGIKTGMRLSEARALCPSALFLPSDYETYCLFSARMNAIVRRYTPSIEEYSIDECFAEISGLRSVFHMSYEAIAEQIRKDLRRELGITFSIGLSTTKVLAKLGSKWKKPDGLTCIPEGASHSFLSATPVGKIWGIGPNTAALLNRLNVRTALEFTLKREDWVTQNVSKPYQEIWRELCGEAVLEPDTCGRKSYQSISKAKTFTPPSSDATFIFSQLSKNIENACIKARRWNLVADSVAFSLKTQNFQYHGCKIKLPHPTNVPQDILDVVAPCYTKIFEAKTLYRATDITLMKLAEEATTQLDLFGAVRTTDKLQKIYTSVDKLSEKFGKHAIFLGSSFDAMTHAPHVGDRNEVTTRAATVFKGENARQRLAIPMLGEVT